MIDQSISVILAHDESHGEIIMSRWVNNYSVMLINLTYNDALNDARIIVDELEKTLKKLGYLSDENYVKFNMSEFLPGNRSEEESVDKFEKTL